jgi:hypothetical protein
MKKTLRKAGIPLALKHDPNTLVAILRWNDGRGHVQTLFRNSDDYHPQLFLDSRKCPITTAQSVTWLRHALTGDNLHRGELTQYSRPLNEWLTWISGELAERTKGPVASAWTERDGQVAGDEFARWLQSIPTGDEAMVHSINVRLALTRSDWFLLARGAARNGVSIAEVIAHVLNQTDATCEIADGSVKVEREKEAA